MKQELVMDNGTLELECVRVSTYLCLFEHLPGLFGKFSYEADKRVKNEECISVVLAEVRPLLGKSLASDTFESLSLLKAGHQLKR